MEISKNKTSKTCPPFYFPHRHLTGPTLPKPTHNSRHSGQCSNTHILPDVTGPELTTGTNFPSMLSRALVHYSEPREDGAVGGEFIWRCMRLSPAAHASAALRLEAQGLQSTYQLRVIHYVLGEGLFGCDFEESNIQATREERIRQRNERVYCFLN